MIPIILAIKDERDRLLVENIYDTYEKKIYMIAYSILKNKQDAEDAVNNTIIKIIDYIDNFVDISCEETKRLIVIYSRSVALNMYNSKKIRSKMSLPICDDENNDHEINDIEENLQDIIINEETISIVRNAIEKLDVKYRDVIILKYYNNMKDAQIADILSISETAVSTRLTRAKNLLKKEGGYVLYARLK
ncbi:ECF RNA polymerase sigma factor SigW [bioreactor metagenome]|uniref:ECF RNA polymerase sigma factor SigW n=1 Tax=bioreactor metagenome TaxID=1076179 RepID=A0A645DPV8_9ZZZZ|nr:RNA polymerase sigma factor [Oscillospiraceae bacterium]